MTKWKRRLVLAVMVIAVTFGELRFLDWFCRPRCSQHHCRMVEVQEGDKIGGILSVHITFKGGTRYWRCSYGDSGAVTER